MLNEGQVKKVVHHCGNFMGSWFHEGGNLLQGVFLTSDFFKKGILLHEMCLKDLWLMVFWLDVLCFGVFWLVVFWLTVFLLGVPWLGGLFLRLTLLYVFNGSFC